MSTQLPARLRAQVRDAARDPDTGLVECAGCHGEFIDAEIQIDHIIPEHRGGGHGIENLQPLCYPKDKAARSCHKDKSAAEAAQRAASRTRLNRSPLVLPISLVSLTAAFVAAKAAWLSYQGKSLVPLLERTEHWLRVSCLIMLILAVLWALSQIGHGEDEKPKAEPKTGETPEQRITAALREEMGKDGQIKVRRIGSGYACSYRGTGFADHEDTAKYQVQQRLGAKMGGRWKCEWETEEDVLYTERRPELPSRIDHPGADRTLPWHCIPISPSVTIDLKVTPHVLVCGTTLAGKTSIFRSAIISTAVQAKAERVRLILFDPKQVELVGFRGWPGIMEVLTEDEELYDMPGEIVDEMRRRMALFTQEKVPLSSHTPWIVVLDEYHEYVKRMGKWSLLNGKRKTVSAPLEPVENIETLLAMARKMNIHLIIGTQRPDAKWFGGDARDLLGFRIGVGGLSPTLARMLFNDSSQGRDIPAEAKGRFTVQVNDGAFVEDQSYWVPDPTDADGENTPADWDLLKRLGMPA